MSEQFDTKISRLAKRYKGLSRLAAACNDLFIYGIYESNFPKLMEDINRAKDHIKIVIKDTKEEIEMSGDGLTVLETASTMEPIESDPIAADIDSDQTLKDKGMK